MVGPLRSTHPANPGVGSKGAPWARSVSEWSDCQRSTALGRLAAEELGHLAGQFGPGWSTVEVVTVVLLAGTTAGGYTGVAYAEYASLGGARRTEATGLGTALMFSGGLLIPPLFGALTTLFDGYAVTYRLVAVMALAGAVSMWRGPPQA